MNLEEELLSKDICMVLFPEFNFRKSERPDFVDEENGVGLEVVKAIPQKICEQQHFIVKNLGKSISKESCKMLEKYGFTPLPKNGIVSRYLRVFGESEKDIIIEAIKDKYKKAVNYSFLPHLYLFVFATQFCFSSFVNDDWEKILNTIKNCEEKYASLFEKIILDFGEEAVLFDTQTMSYQAKKYHIKVSEPSSHL